MPMKIRMTRPGRLGSTIRELARRKPDEAEDYLDSHHDAWEELAGDDPHDAADILEALDEEGAADLLQELPVEEAGDVLDEMHPEAAADVLQELLPDEAAALVSEMETDQAVDLIGALDAEERTAVLSSLDPRTAREVERLLIYAADTAGGMMTTDVAALAVEMSAAAAIEELRQLHDELGSNVRYVYVVDAERRLLGVVPFRKLVFATPATGLDDLMETNIVSVRTDTDREEVAEEIQRYNLIAIPVVDAHGVLVGMVKVSEAIEAILAEVSEDITMMVGAGAEETVFTPVARSVRRRLPWIFLNLLVGVLLAGLISRFESILTTFAILAAYMPTVALLSGSSGAQSVAVIIRSMAVGDLPPGRAGRAIRREVAVGVVDGTAMAFTGALIAALTVTIFQSGTDTIPPAQMAAIVFVSIWISFFIAGLVGSGIPVALRRLGQDPALASNIFLTMITDTVSFASFLITATLLLT
jgi:magnesium transporter